MNNSTVWIVVGIVFVILWINVYREGDDDE